jgi:hypothetical protein
MLYYLYYCQIAHDNSSDVPNPWLWSRLVPEVCAAANPTLFLAIGTILGRRVPAEPVKTPPLYGAIPLGWETLLT